MIVHTHTKVFARTVAQTVQLSSNKAILVPLRPNSQRDSTLGYKYNHVKLQAQSLCMFIKKKKFQGKDMAPMKKETKSLLPKQKGL